ncbi:phage antirepressor KilAC domain-containing protein [Leuconostoc mesenteroides]|uniref:phage antirepressor KilAC domain-containing protein n=1 Tax=Leuconostoc mesenteroides TaxID=1245 RepID=UPI002360C735|nr:phage antirepressor KilAC domain-containing protein [Leuconostoc mesenteroides]
MTNDEIVGQALRIEHDRAERLAVELSVTKPKAEMHDVFIEKGQAIGIREASKELNVKQNDLIDNLMNNGYVYRTKGHNGKLQPIKKIRAKVFRIEKRFGQRRRVYATDVNHATRSGVLL